MRPDLAESWRRVRRSGLVPLAHAPDDRRNNQKRREQSTKPSRDLERSKDKGVCALSNQVRVQGDHDRDQDGCFECEAEQPSSSQRGCWLALGDSHSASITQPWLTRAGPDRGPSSW